MWQVGLVCVFMDIYDTFILIEVDVLTVPAELLKPCVYDLDDFILDETILGLASC